MKENTPWICVKPSVNNYRKNIDGLRALAVIAVIVFHYGFLPNGYLGVDVFFVISGYLITGTILNELNENKFSMVNFYLRRIRRIIPLALFITLVTLVIGVAKMLPDDLENLAQSVVATNLFSNNILQAITTKNYWDIANEFKPLMHTWSLGVEEQYHLFYLLLFWLLGTNNRSWILPILLTFTVVSFVLYISSYSDYEKFYLIPFRFYELSVGGIAAIYLKNNLFVHKFSPLFVFSLIFVLFFDLNFMSNQKLLLPIVVLLTLGIIVSSNEESKLSKFVLENKAMVFVGLISFSLYMWHQVLLSYARYFLVQKLETPHFIIIFILTVMFSILSYQFIEQPFRNKNRVNTKILLFTLSLSFLLINSIAFYIYLKGGVLKDIPELGITKDQATRNIHAKYNHRIHAYDKNFSSINKLRVLVIGNSFARDWVNVLLESKHKNNLDISYIFQPDIHVDLTSRSHEADVIFFYSPPSKSNITRLGIDKSKLFVIGTKKFGVNSGIFYNYTGSDYFKQRTSISDRYLETNKKLSDDWGVRYLDYIAKIISEDKTVPVFTPNNKFISQDTEHFTKAGAQYFSQLFESELTSIFNNAKN